jgi:hypothetical protein
MHRTARTILSAALFFAVASPVLAQSNVSTLHKLAWSENCGWLNFRDAGSPSGSSGVRVHASFLSGFAWGENIGHINFGDATPANGMTYANATSADFGVNLNPATGALTGMAWGENIGWINFAGGAAAGPAFAARLDYATQRLRGYAWGENVGWINLDNANHYVGFGCPADVDDGSSSGTPDGGVTIDDLLYYLAILQQGDIAADLDDGSNTGTPDGGVTIDDLLYFLARYGDGC